MTYNPEIGKHVCDKCGVFDDITIEETEFDDVELCDKCWEELHDIVHDWVNRNKHLRMVFV